MQTIFASLFMLAAALCLYSQTPELQPLLAAQAGFDRVVTEKDMRSGFLEILADDAIVFQPEPVNGKKYWTGRDGDSTLLLVRKPTYSDISSNGMLGYTTGNWRTYKKGESEALARFGQFVTIWEKKPDGKFLASVDIAVSHEKMPFTETDRQVRRGQTRDLNKRGWSPADASMDFLRLSMAGERLGGAYKKFAADDVRLLRDSAPPIIGKKHVVKEMNAYVSVKFPERVVLMQAADMAYTWNACQFDNSNEGTVQGNCLHIWKLRKKKWWIVLGVFAPVPNETVPVLKVKPRSKT